MWYRRRGCHNEVFSTVTAEAAASIRAVPTAPQNTAGRRGAQSVGVDPAEGMVSAMKQDAFEAMVEKALPQKIGGPLVTRDNVAKLLRAQHRAFVRLVKKIPAVKGWENFIHRIDLLAALAALAAKGKGGKR